MKNTLLTISFMINAFLLSSCANTSMLATKNDMNDNASNAQQIKKSADINNSQASNHKLNNYKIDPHHANVRFAINHMNTSTITGGFYELTGDLKFSKKRKKGYIDISIPMDSLHSVSKVFIEKLKSDSFFDIAKYPTARFKSTDWYFNGDDITSVKGMLTMHGKTNPVTLTANSFNCYFHPLLQKNVCGGDFSTVIDRTKWGIDKYVLLGVTKEVTIDIEIEAVKQ